MVKYKQFLILTLVGAPLIVDLATRTMQPPETQVPVDAGLSGNAAPAPAPSGGTVVALPPSSGATMNMMQGQQSASLDGIDPAPAMDPTPALSPATDPAPAPPSAPPPAGDAGSTAPAATPPVPQNY